MRSKLAVDKIEMKITRRALQRVGHVLRMDNEGLARKVFIGWPAKERTRNGSRNQTTLDYWRKLITDAADDSDTVEALTIDIKKWSRLVNRRINYTQEWDKGMAKRGNMKSDQRKDRCDEHNVTSADKKTRPEVD